jgi:hypothetical protein
VGGMTYPVASYTTMNHLVTSKAIAMQHAGAGLLHHCQDSGLPRAKPRHFELSSSRLLNSQQTQTPREPHVLLAAYTYTTTNTNKEQRTNTTCHYITSKSNGSPPSSSRTA